MGWPSRFRPSKLLDHSAWAGDVIPDPQPRARPSPNIWNWPGIYETENRAQDRTGEIWKALRGHRDWTDLDVVDVGCGDGFHLPVFAADARSVRGLEPHPPLVRSARDRLALASDTWGRCAEVLLGGAQHMPLPAGSADLVHARTAYFFGPGCEPGLAEAERILRPGGTLAIVDLDATSSPYGDWMRADLPDYDPDAVESFFDRHGFRSVSVQTTWCFDTRDDLEAVLGIEFAPNVAQRALRETSGCSLPVRYRLRTREKPHGLLRVDG